MISSLSDAELHGLVDGQIEVHRRADILRRAAGSVADRERIAAWQGQGDLIRDAFQGVEREPLPSALDLRAPARLHALPLGRPTVASEQMPIASEPDRKRVRLLAPSLTVLVAACGVAATWFAGGFSAGVPQAVPASFEDVVAHRTSGVLTTSDEGVNIEPTAMPTAAIPDLTPLGFTLTGAEAQIGEPVSLVFRYRNAAAEQVAIGVARTNAGAGQRTLGAGRSIPGKAMPVGDALVWHAGNRTYALAGTLGPERLRTLLGSLRDLALEE